MTRADLERWIADYERLWRTPGTGALRELFADDAVYRAGPHEDAVRGLAKLAEFWEAEREGAGETFEMTSEVVAVDGDTGVARIDVHYGTGEIWADLWIVTLGADGRCTAFEEWPVAP